MKHYEPEDELGVPQWMITFSDLLTLLLGFFVMRFAALNVDQGKLDETVQYFRSAPTLERPAEIGGGARRPSVQVTDLQAVLAERLGFPPLKTWPAKEAAKGAEMLLRLTDDGAILTLRGSLFPEGSPELTFRGAELLKTIGRAVPGRDVEVELRTYSGDYVLGEAQAGSPWELAAARTAVELRQMIDAGVEPSLLSAAIKARFLGEKGRQRSEISELTFRIKSASVQGAHQLPDRN